MPAPCSHCSLMIAPRYFGATNRGAELEAYETPKTVDGIAEVPVGRAAWLRDPDGNLIGLVQFARRG